MILIPHSQQLLAKFRTTRRQKGFTLVEVVLALGVASFGLISMMGLLTVGLKTAHDAMSATTETEIAQQMANQLQIANYSNIKTQTTPTHYYFTQEGLQTNAANAVYFAKIAPPTALTVPGGTAATSLNTLTFVISIWSASSPQAINVTPIQIANNGS